MPRCFLHLGTYKTGSSSVQLTLDKHRTSLETLGFLYPRAGIVPELCGHHNIAWEIAGSPSYDRQHGSIAELISEISQSRQDVILSSEDFALALPLLADFKSFLERLKQCGLEIAIIIYFRNPADTLRSAYFELLKAGCPVALGPFISAMLEDQIVRWGNRAAGGVDIVGALRQLATDKDISIIARSYDRARNFLIADFLSVFGLTLAELGVETEARKNERMMIGGALALFYRNRTGRLPDSREEWLISCLADALGGDDIHLSDRAKQMVWVKYEDQRQFLRQYGNGELDISAQGARDSIAEWDTAPCLEDVFSVATVRFIEHTARKLV